MLAQINLISCADLDRQIDALVYELYELTDKEIKLVEESAQKAK